MNVAQRFGSLSAGCSWRGQRERGSSPGMESNRESSTRARGWRAGKPPLDGHGGRAGPTPHAAITHSQRSNGQLKINTAYLLFLDGTSRTLTQRREDSWQRPNDKLSDPGKGVLTLVYSVTVDPNHLGELKFQLPKATEE